MNDVLPLLIVQYLEGMITAEEFANKVVDVAYQTGYYQPEGYTPKP